MDLNVYFSPHGQCQERLLQLLAQETTHIWCQAYQFTAKPVAEAFLAARARGVEVVVVLDASQPASKTSQVRLLAEGGARVYIDRAHAIAHNKLILLRGTGVVVGGSYNYTRGAETKNAENLTVLTDAGLVFSQYAANFHEHLGHSQPFSGTRREPLARFLRRMAGTDPEADQD